MNDFKKRKIIEILPQQQVVTICFDETIGDALHKMTVQSISSLPVIYREQVFGFVDVLDLVGFLVQQCCNPLGLSPSLKWSNIRDLMERSSEFNMKQVADALDLSRRNPFKTCEASNTVEDALLPFREGIHRVAVVDKGRMIGVLSQADVIHWMATHPYEIKIRDVTVKRVRWKSDSVLYTSPQTSAFDAFLRMWESRVTSIGVVQHGQLLLVLSASDIKCGLDNQLLSFEWLQESVRDFLQRVHHLQGKPSNFLVTCKEDSKLQDVIQALHKERIHRIFICDQINRPVGVMSLTDIIREVTFEVESST